MPAAAGTTPVETPTAVLQPSSTPTVEHNVLLPSPQVAGHAPRIRGVQGIAVPAYFALREGYWTQLDREAPTVGMAVINPQNGPGPSFSQAYASQVRTSQKAGIIVLGYVYTHRGTRSLAAVEADVDTYDKRYHLDGIFVDEVDNLSCSAESTYYLPLYNHIKAWAGKAVVALNPGLQTLECFMSASDIVVTFEDEYSHYARSYAAPSWVNHYPANRFWHIVINAPSVKTMQHAIELSRMRNAGWVWVTNGRLPNPYVALPSGPYWSDELALVRYGRGPSKTPTATATCRLTATQTITPTQLIH
jgi:hypothetical protein